MGVSDWLGKAQQAAAPRRTGWQPTAAGPPHLAASTWLQQPTLVDGSFHHVVGESHRLADLAEVLRTLPADWRVVNAQLVREPTNQYDRDAVMVLIGGRHVGYIPKESARRFHPVIDHLHSSGFVATCRAHLTGGHFDRPNIGVVLHLADPLVVASQDRGLLTGGTPRRIAAKSLDVEYAHRLLAGDARRIVVGRTSIKGHLVAIEVAGARLGQLTPGESAKSAPVVALAQAAGLDPTVGIAIKLDGGKVEVRAMFAHGHALEPT